jgi:sulfatase modifying factor 1
MDSMSNLIRYLIIMLIYSTSGKDIWSSPLPKMVFVQGGVFKIGDMRGDADEQPVHAVHLTDYHIAKTEITLLQWKAYCSTAHRAMPASTAWGWIDHHSIVNISWDDATDYCKWLSAETGKRYRLPSEAEWEFAARGGKLSKGFLYSGSNDVDKVGFYKALSSELTQLVAQKDSNELGLYDMSGNVWEWCADWYANAYPSADEVKDPKGPLTGRFRIIRGGG